MAGIVQLENVGLRFGTDAETLHDLSFTLTRGSFNWLVGPSGAGKSSLLRLIAGELAPSRGIVRLFGEDVAAIRRGRRPALRRRIGLLPQAAALVAGLSAFDNVALPLRIANVAEAEISSRVSEVLEWVGLGARGACRPEALSGAERQRAGLARAVIARPEILIADEPTGDVDAGEAAWLIGLLAILHRAGTTLLVATHDPAPAETMAAAHTLRLSRGRLEKPAEPVELPRRRKVPA